MTLLLNNDDVRRLLTTQMTMEALEEAYRQLARRDAVCRPRIDIRIPNGDGERVYQWGTMEGGSSVSGYFAIRMKSDVVSVQPPCVEGAAAALPSCPRWGRTAA
jgi:alanine dehydrogenase